eukprot:Nitzschia sp. Nitz4//scaffold139_size61406//16490//17671//NITZ4_006451-RA/size61406-processed-gene-0.61-mRNA-1//-1//CDS//3329535825//2260//frame0
MQDKSHPLRKVSDGSISVRTGLLLFLIGIGIGRQLCGYQELAMLALGGLSKLDPGMTDDGDSNLEAEYATNYKNIPPQDCVAALGDAESLHDPNIGTPLNMTSRYTTTDPQFWISLYIQRYDPMRWTSIMNKGFYYEKHITNIFVEILSEENPSATGSNTLPPALVLDVGMNIGWYTLVSRSLGYHVASFDANPLMFIRVCESLKLNNWDSDGSVSLFPYGLGSEESVLTFTVDRNPGASSFVDQRASGKKVPVRVVTLDDVATQEGWMNRDIPILKMDVEGFEKFVVQGGQKLIHDGNIRNILMETSDHTNLPDTLTMLDFIYGAGFRVHQIGSNTNGRPFKVDSIPVLNEFLQNRSGVEENEKVEPPTIDEKIDFLHRYTVNLWWKRGELP